MCPGSVNVKKLNLRKVKPEEAEKPIQGCEQMIIVNSSFYTCLRGIDLWELDQNLHK